MTELPGQFDLFGNEISPAEAARDQAIDQVEKSSDYWTPYAIKAIREIAASRTEFTTDAVWALLERWEIPSPHERRALGAAMRKAFHLGLCERTDRTKKSVRVDCHARPVRVWRSLV